MDINSQTLAGDWNRIKGKLHERWGQVTEDELQQVRGNVDQIIGVIQRKTGEARERVEQYLSELTGQGSNAAQRVAEAVRGYAEQAAENFDDAKGRAAVAFRGGVAQSEQVVRQHPFESLAVTFGAGLVAGVVIGLSMRGR